MNTVQPEHPPQQASENRARPVTEDARKRLASLAHQLESADTAVAGPHLRDRLALRTGLWLLLWSARSEERRLRHAARARHAVQAAAVRAEHERSAWRARSLMPGSWL